MRACVDGIVYGFQRRGGVSRVHSEVLPRMCDLDPELRIAIYLGGPSRQALPMHARIRHYPPAAMYRALGGGRIARRLAPRLARASAWVAARRAADAIWHSTFYTRPPAGGWSEIVTVHDMIHERFPALFSGPDDDRFRARKRECILNARAIICVSQATRDDLFAFCSPSTPNVHVIPLACNNAFRVLDEPAAPAPNKPFVLYVGDRAGAHKNFRLVLDAFAEWRARHDVDLVVAGQPWSEAEQRVLVAKGIERNVRLVVDPEDTDLAQLYNDALMLVHPSLHEGFGIPLLEAMACGCPIAASRIPSTVEVTGDCATYFDARDAHSFIQALDTTAGARADRKRMQAGLARARRHSWDRTAAETLAVYRSVVSAS